MKRLSIWVICCSWGFYLAAQHNDAAARYFGKDHYKVSLPSPQASSLASSYKTGVDPYTGKLNVSFPVGSISSHSLSMNFTVDVKPNMRVNDIAGWLGNASLGTGVITRTMNGHPDEGIHRYLKKMNNGETLWRWVLGYQRIDDHHQKPLDDLNDHFDTFDGQDHDPISQVEDRKTFIYNNDIDALNNVNVNEHGTIEDEWIEDGYDLEQDIFDISIPSCRGGGMMNFKMAISENRIPVLLAPATADVKIQPFYSELEIDGLVKTHLTMFKILTDEGCLYTFGDTTNLKGVEFSRHVTMNTSTTYNYFIRDNECIADESAHCNRIGSFVYHYGDPEIAEFQSAGSPVGLWKIDQFSTDLRKYYNTSVQKGGETITQHESVYDDHRFISMGEWNYSTISVPKVYPKMTPTLIKSPQFTSAFYLTKIEDLNASDFIELKYSEEAVEVAYTQNLSKSYNTVNVEEASINGRRYIRSRVPNARPEATLSISSDVLFYTSIKLERIIAKNGSSVNFISETPNYQLQNEKLLDKVDFYNPLGKLTSSLELEYKVYRPDVIHGDRKYVLGYFYQRTAKFNEYEMAFRFMNPLYYEDMVKARHYRPMLTKIWQKGSSRSSEEKPAFDLTYYDNESLPERFSEKQDTWGYANDNQVASLIPRFTYSGQSFVETGELSIQPALSKDNSYNHSTFPYRPFVWSVENRGTKPAWAGADRDPKIEKAQALSLKTLRLPEGGLLEFEYGLNQTSDGRVVGGLRVEREHRYPMWPAAKGKMTTFYNYQEGALAGEPLYVDEKFHLDSWSKKISISEQASNVELTRGGVVGYGKTTIEKQGEDGVTNGSKVYRYLTPEDIPNKPGLVKMVTGVEDADAYFNSHLEDLSQVPHKRINQDWKRGLLKNTEIFHANGDLVSLSTSEYETVATGNVDRMLSIKSAVYGDPIADYFEQMNNVSDQWVQNPGRPDDQGEEPDAGVIPVNMWVHPAYNFQYSVWYPEAQKYKQQKNAYSMVKGNAEDPSSSYETNETFEWTSLGHLKKFISVDSKGETTVHEYKYPYELEGEVYELMNEKRIRLPIEKVTYKTQNGQYLLLSAAKNSYVKHVFLDKRYVRLAKMEIAEIESTESYIDTDPYERASQLYKEVYHFDKWDEFGHLLTDHAEEDLSTSYQWGFHNSVPVASATNATDDQFFYQGFEENDQIEEDAASARTGIKSLESSSYVVPFTPRDSEVYLMSYWVFAWSEEHQDNRWQLRKDQPFTNTINESGVERIDDITVYKKGARISYYSYNKLGLVSSITDQNHRTSTFEFDHYNRLKLNRDHKGNLTGYFDYQYNQSVN